MGHWRCFRQAVAFHELASCQFLELDLDLDGKRRRTTDTRLDRRQVVVFQVGVINQGDVHRRRAGEQGRLALVDHLENLFDLELRHEDDFCGNANAFVHHCRHAVDVKERKHAQNSLAASAQLVEDSLALHRIGDQIGMRQHDAFGYPCRAARVLEQGDVLFRVDWHMDRGDSAFTAERKGSTSALYVTCEVCPCFFWTSGYSHFFNKEENRQHLSQKYV